jgi:CheY-like chemotaxis protein
MDGEIHLDDDYYSGIPGHPGTRFVVNLREKPIEQSVAFSSADFDKVKSSGVSGETGNTQCIDDDLNSLPNELPEKMSVLFVDDDSILRKLFVRSIKTLAPSWTVREASNGEAALLLTDSENFDLIFVDMYMASVERQLLGTETVQQLRARCVKSRICGLSANDKESEFFDAGANAFMFKPFPCESYALTQELCRVLFQDQKGARDDLG